MNKTCIVTGGSGFVGTHLIQLFVEQNIYEKIIILDLKEPPFDFKGVHYKHGDVRKAIDPESLKKLGCDEDTVIYNLAAICRIPGFPDIDYFRTNISGAENVCQLADDLGCRKIVFTSSIAPYGASEELKTEDSVPQPDNPYGSSKLVAEYIHKGWQQKEPGSRLLSVLRPGIIFGKGEQANFTRLYNSLISGYFAYPGRKDTKKACVYVKDIARACHYFSYKKMGIHLYNLVYPDPPTIETIAETVAKRTDARAPFWHIPNPVLMTAAYSIKMVGKLVDQEFSGIHPDRVKKVKVSTNVSGRKLKDEGFELQYSLGEAISDWYKDCGNKRLC